MVRQRNNLVRHLLTDRQLEILDLTVNKELGPEEIAKKLFIEKRTVDWHMEKIRKQYDTPSWTLAIVRYIKELDNVPE